jgi:hypothetical protein
LAALIVEVVFGIAGLIPHERHGQVVEASISWNYTTWLNIVFLALAAILMALGQHRWPRLLRMMNRPTSSGEMHHAH